MRQRLLRRRAQQAAASAPATASSARAYQRPAPTAGEEKAAPPLDLSIKRFALNDGTVNVHDEAASRPVDLGLQKLAVTLTDFSTLATTPAHYTLNTDFKDDGGSLGAEGAFGLVAKTASAKLDLKSLKLPLLQPYIDTATAAQVTDGALSATVNLDANWSKSPAAVMVTDTQLDLQSLKLAARDSKAPVISLAQGQVTVKQVDVAARTADITSVDTTGLVVDAQRLKDGSINLAALAGPHEAAQQRTAIHAAKKAQEEGPAWHYKIGELNLKDATANFTDNTTPHPVKLSITPLQLKVQQISDDLSRPLPVDLQATLNKKGHARREGRRHGDAAQGGRQGEREPARRGGVRTVLRQQAECGDRERAAQRERRSRAEPGEVVESEYRGDVALVDVRMLDKATSDPFAGWGSLALVQPEGRLRRTRHGGRRGPCHLHKVLRAACCSMRKAS